MKCDDEDSDAGHLNHQREVPRLEEPDYVRIDSLHEQQAEPRLRVYREIEKPGIWQKVPST